MNILVLNVGSSSLKYRLTESDTDRELCAGIVDRIGNGPAKARHHWLDRNGAPQKWDNPCAADNHSAAFDAFCNHLHLLQQQQDLPPIDAIGHRVVHGGSDFQQPVLITPQVLDSLEPLNKLAPLHNPHSLAVIRLCQQHFPGLPQVAVFDTSFHQTMPERAYRYGVPNAWYHQHQVRRYGFHGISHGYVAQQAADYLGKPLVSLKLITLHLGNGASAAAIAGGRSIDTSMGMSPLDGLLMGTRSGDIDPTAIFHMGREANLTMAELEQQLSAESGLIGLCGASDMREVISRSDVGDSAAQLALEMYCYRIRKYIGAYVAALGGLDALVFTAGVGENAARVRAMACAGLECLGIHMDDARNGSAMAGVTPISPSNSPVAVLVIPTNEELAIAREVAALLNKP